MISKLAFSTAIALALANVAYGQTASSPETVYINGNVHTVDEDSPGAEAFAVRDGRFVAVGTNDEIQALAGDGTEVVDLEGRTVIPGFLDNHLHQLSAALNAPLVSLLDARSVADVKELIAERVATTPSGEWVRASSAWHESTLSEGRLPTRTELDEVSPDSPVYIPRGGHVAVVNSAALELAGISKDTPDPDGGVIVRDDGGEPTGLLLESAAKLMQKVLPPAAPAEEQQGLLIDFMRELNGFGVVGVVEPGISEEQLALYKDVADQGKMTVRTHALYRIAGLEDARKFVGSYDRDFKSEMLSLDGVKYLLDGGVEGAYLRDPYEIVEGEQTDPEFRGVLLMPKGGESELAEAYALLAEAGWQVQTHAVGDATIDAALDVYEQVDAETDISDLRWALMHVFLPTEEAISRMKGLDVLATVQDHALLLGHNQLRYWGEERAAYAIPIRSLLDADVKTSGGTDAPVLPASPFLSISWMSTRILMNGEVLGPEQAISREEALRLWTLDTAYLMGVEERQGSIEKGKLADFVVLSDDLLTVPDEAIRDVRALKTVLGGEVVYESND